MKEFYLPIVVWLISIFLFAGSITVVKSGKSETVKLSRPVYTGPLPSPLPEYDFPQNSAPQVNKETSPQQNLTPEDWGVAEQIDEVTWTIKVGQDNRMAAPDEILKALNNYRALHGSGKLNWDSRLAEFAQQRAEYFRQIKGLDQHKGFKEYVKKEENVRALGFAALGENASYGYRLSGVHLIEWVFAGDEPHDKNQRDQGWTHVGIGVSGTGVALIFGHTRI